MGMTGTYAAMGFFSVIAVLLAMILTVLWIFVPFAIFGIKPLLRQVLARMETAERQNAQLLQAVQSLQVQRRE